MKKILVLTAGLLLMSATLYAGNGDLIVGGKVGVGSTNSPNSSLDVRGNIVTDSVYAFSNSQQTQSPYGVYITAPGANLLGFYTNSSERMRISGDGKVGIGTLVPDYRLHVMGLTYSSGGFQPSDINFKKEIKLIDNALDKVKNLSGYSYLYKTDEYKDKGFPEGKQLGVIAQELELVIPEAVMTLGDGTKAVNYSEIIPVLIEAIKEQQKEIDDLKDKISKVK